MHLIAPLVSGIAGAASGSVQLWMRGTSTPALYYRDFEATQTYAAQPIQLDSSGGATIYVTALVDVQVFDLNGALVREFVAGINASAVEVLSPAFTGTSYSTGQTAAGLPTTLASILGAVWLASAGAGATDFGVVVNGSRVTLQTAVAGLAGLYFNVKSYGAIGNGSADDTTSIRAALTAAAATSTGGGIVFFPPGVYRVTDSVTLPTGITLLGCGGQASKLAMDNATPPTQLLLFNGGDIKGTRVEGLWFGALSSYPGSLVFQAAYGRLSFADCLFGADNNVAGQLFVSSATSAANLTVFERCYFESRGGAVRQLVGDDGRINCRDCDFVNAQTTAIVHCDVKVADFAGCRFDMTSVTGSGGIYVSGSPNPALGPIAVRGCFFGQKASGGSLTCLYNALATPTVDFIESDNQFGSVSGFSNVVPYAYAVDGYASASGTCTGSHGSRKGAVECYGALTAASVMVNPKANGVTTLQRTSGATLGINGTLGSYGDIWLLQITNTSGGNVVVSFNSLFVILTSNAANTTVTTGDTQQLLFMFLPGGTGTTGLWRQIAVVSQT